MRKIPYKTWLLACVFVLMPWVAHAAGLGKLSILSALGQPLVAEIDLISVQKDEFSTLTARLASPEAFRQANILYSPALIGVRLNIERRADGQPYIRITSTRAVNEPFIDLLIELSWAQGRLVREYTALIDPPDFAPGAAPAAPVAVAPAAPETRAITPAPPAVASPIEARPAAKAPAVAPAQRPAAVSPKADGNEYGPVRRGETLYKIAASVKPEGVTLEQMLVNLYRSNPDAFVGNMNRLKTGRILRVPEKEQLADTGQAEAVKEIRVQTANWNAYRQKLAEAAGETPAKELKSAVSGKITTTVDDKAAGAQAPKEVLRLSKGEPVRAPGTAVGGKPVSAQERVRALEEEATAREKALAEANDRIAQLEKTIKDMQRLLEVKGQVAGAPPAEKPAAAEPPKAEAPKGDAAKAEPPKGEQAAPEPPQPKPKPKIVAPPPPPPAPSLVDEIMGEPLYLVAIGGLVILLGGVGYWLVRRRASAFAGGEEKAEKQAPKFGKAAPGAAAAMAAAPVTAAAGGEDVDPLAEADLYLNFGRDAQAEEVLKEALAKNPKHEAAQLKLLQIYAGRKDKTAFEKVARNLNAQTGPASDTWLKAAAMGYAFDPVNALYGAGKSAPAGAMPAAGGAAGGTDLDFDLELSPTTGVTQTDLELEAGKTMIMEPGELSVMAAGPDSATEMVDITSDTGVARTVAEGAAAPDFTLNVPAGTQPPVEPDITLDGPGDSAAPMAGMIDFNFDVAAPAAAAPAAEGGKGFTHGGTVILSPENQDKAAGLTVDFDMDATAKIDAVPGAQSVDASAAAQLEPDLKLDLGADTAAPVAPEFKLDDINLNLDETPRTEAPAAPREGGAKDDRWYDVQTKFDLAKAYQEMGDRDGAREILQEVIKEGDSGQQTEAKQLLDNLG